MVRVGSHHQISLRHVHREDLDHLGGLQPHDRSRKRPLYIFDQRKFLPLSVLLPLDVESSRCRPLSELLFTSWLLYFCPFRCAGQDFCMIAAQSVVAM